MLASVHHQVFNAVLVASAGKGLVDGILLARQQAAEAAVATSPAAAAGGCETHEPTAKDETRLPLPQVTRRELLAREAVAWPTVALLAASLSGWFGAWVLRLKFGWGPWRTVPISVLSTYWSFTVLHDAVHGAVSSKYKWLNALMGMLGGIPLMAPYNMFKVIHLSHHKYSGDHDSAPDHTSLDPDEWAGRGPWFLLPLRWATVLHYYAWWFTKFMTARALNPHTPPQVLEADARIRRTGFIQLILTTLLLRTLARWDAKSLSVCWLLPHTISTAFLMYFFDYVPHRPHVIPYKQDPYRSTNATTFSPWGKVDEAWWTFVCLSQNMHVVHHIWPSVPFYRYKALWQAHEQELRDKGVRVTPLFITRPMEEVFEELKAP